MVKCMAAFYQTFPKFRFSRLYVRAGSLKLLDRFRYYTYRTLVKKRTDFPKLNVIRRHYEDRCSVIYVDKITRIQRALFFHSTFRKSRSPGNRNDVTAAAVIERPFYVQISR